MMADVAVHTVLGAGIAVGAAKLVGLEDYRVVATVYGAVMGAAPDAFDWIAAKLGWTARWVNIYAKLHDATLATLWAILLLAQPPLLVGHFLPDKIFHASGPEWWPRLWWLAILMWLVGISLLWWGYTPK